MAAGIAPLESHVEDVLEHLPASGTTQYGKSETIYGPNDIPTSIYMVVAGRVGISHLARDGKEVLLEIVRADELFGVSAFLGAARASERATALQPATLMSWPVADMKDLVTKRPQLAVALLQVLAQRNAKLTRRVESLTMDRIERRLASSLLRLSERLGSPESDGSVRMMPLTHTLLSQYVGTSREVVTGHMNQFRKRGYLSYSRQGICLYCESLESFLETGRAPSPRTVS